MPWELEGNGSQSCSIPRREKEPAPASAAAGLLVQACSRGLGDGISGEEERKGMICGLRTSKICSSWFLLSQLGFLVFFFNMDAVFFSWGVNAVTGCYRGMGRAVAGLCSLLKLELLGRR